MKRIALAVAGLAVLIVIGIAVVNWWGYHSAIRSAANAPVEQITGNPNGSLTIVEFVDYQCPYCQQLHKTLTEVLKDEPDVRIVFRSLPWLRDSSQIATFVAATSVQGKEVELHKALLNKDTPQNYVQVKQTAYSLGVNVPKAENDMKNPAMLKKVNDNLNLALALKLPSTPALLIGTKLYVPTKDTMPSTTQLRSMIEAEKGNH